MPREVDVFLSFYCQSSHRYFENILYGIYGIRTFLSFRSLETRVRPIDQQTREALEEAKVAVVMTSETKPYTVGFLEELKVILEFQARGSLKVIPIFLTPYLFQDVEEEICQQYPENVLIWKIALQKLANIAAEYPFSQDISDMDQSDRFKRIANDIYLLLLYSTSSDLNGLVAMDRHMKVVHDLLASEVNTEVRTIGIWGSTGVGKTTLARYLYAEISVKFQTYVFLENVEHMKDRVLEFEGKDQSVIRRLDHVGHDIAEARRKHRKVLLIADDVNNIEQGKWIIEYAKLFAPGSRVILISDNENLLADAEVKHMYEVRSLRYDEALQLFSHFAFRQPYPPSDFEQLAVRAVHLAGFLPLALKLLGSFLNGKGQQEWVVALRKLKEKRSANIMEVWKLMEPLKIMEEKESAKDKGPEEREATAEIVKGKESAKDKGPEEGEATAEIVEGKESAKDEGPEERPTLCWASG